MRDLVQLRRSEFEIYSGHIVLKQNGEVPHGLQIVVVSTLNRVLPSV